LFWQSYIPEKGFKKMLSSRINRFTGVVLKTWNFYKNRGLKTTVKKIFDQLRIKIIQKFFVKKYSYKSILSDFHQKFNAPKNIFWEKRKWVRNIDLAAQAALQGVPSRLIPVLTSREVLSALKAGLKNDQYYEMLRDLFTLEHFIAASSNNSTIYPILQTSKLPEITAKARRRRILFITSQFPTPYHGGGNRVLNFIKVLSTHNDIYLSTHFVAEQDSGVMGLLEPYCHSIQTIPFEQFGGNQAKIRDWLNGTPMDIVHYEWPRALENYDPDFGRIQIFTYMEAISLRLKMDIDRLQPLSPAWVGKFAELAYALRLELADAAQVSARIAVTTKDGEFFKGFYPHQTYSILNHGLTFDEFELPDVVSEPHSLVFVGNYAHYPNVDAIEFFFNEMWPVICAEVPDTRITLVGPNPPEIITRRADGRQVFVIGGVPDIRPYIQKASIGIAPLISGAGMRGKVIDYAALRRTFVATSLAVTDLVFEDQVDFYCADTAHDFAQKIISLLKDESLAGKMSAAAFETAKQNYDNKRLTDFLVRLYEHLENE
jgi:glycosyltransferase involved in cell wall biosynthesis